MGTSLVDDSAHPLQRRRLAGPGHRNKRWPREWAIEAPHGATSSSSPHLTPVGAWAIARKAPGMPLRRAPR
jgi:hypothetical protein